MLRHGPERTPVSAGRVAAYLIMIGVTLLWITPVAWALYTALRSYSETSKYALPVAAPAPDPAELRLAGNLLPPQVLITPLYRMCLRYAAPHQLDHEQRVGPPMGER